jgi:hypothetical protein
MPTRVQPWKDSSGKISIQPEALGAGALFVCAQDEAATRNEKTVIRSQRKLTVTPLPSQNIELKSPAQFITYEHDTDLKNQFLHSLPSPLDGMQTRV